MAITPLPDPPSRLDPTTFADKGDAFVAALVRFQEELNSAASAFGLYISASSTTSLTIGTGSHSLTVQADKGFTPGTEVKLTSAADIANHMYGAVSSYDSMTGALTVEIAHVGGSGTFADWTVTPITLVNYSAEILSNKTLDQTNLVGALDFARATVASSASTSDIWSAAGNQIDWTGTAVTTGFPVAPQAGAERVLICADACSFTAGANMLIDGVASGSTVTCAAGDQMVVRALTTTQFKLSRIKCDGTAQVAAVTQFVASGAIPSAGLAVALNDDGTVSIVSSFTETIAGAAVVFDTSIVSGVASCYDSVTGKVVIAYRDAGNSGYGTAIVGTVSGTSITFGIPAVFRSAQVTGVSAAFNVTDNRVVVVSCDTGTPYYAYATVGTISGTTISFGTPVAVASAHAVDTAICYDSVNNKVVVVYEGGASPYYVYAAVGTVSGTSISFGSTVAVESAVNTYVNACFDDASGKVVVAYAKEASPYYGYAVVGTVSGTSISFGSPNLFAATIVNEVSLCHANGKVVFAYRNYELDNYGYAIAGTVSGTSISFGTAVVFDHMRLHSSDYHAISCADISNGRVAISYTGYPSGYLEMVVCSISGTTITVDTPVTVLSAETLNLSTSYDVTSDRLVVICPDEYADVGKATVVELGTSNNLDTVGIAQSSAADTGAVMVKIPGQVDANQIGLTAGATYYVAEDGTITTSSENGFLIGKALSSTELLITNWGL